MTDVISMLDQRFSTGAARLSCQVLTNAILEKDDRWICDTNADHPFSLRWCCLAISLAIGDALDPETIRDHYLRGGTKYFEGNRFGKYVSGLNADRRREPDEANRNRNRLRRAKSRPAARGNG